MYKGQEVYLKLKYNGEVEFELFMGWSRLDWIRFLPQIMGAAQPKRSAARAGHGKSWVLQHPTMALAESASF